MNSTLKQEKYGLYAIGLFNLAVIIVVLIGDFSEKFPIEEYNAARKERLEYIARQNKYEEEQIRARDSLLGANIIRIEKIEGYRDSVIITTENGVIEVSPQIHMRRKLDLEISK